MKGRARVRTWIVFGVRRGDSLRRCCGWVSFDLLDANASRAATKATCAPRSGAWTAASTSCSTQRTAPATPPSTRRTPSSRRRPTRRAASGNRCSRASCITESTLLDAARPRTSHLHFQVEGRRRHHVAAGAARASTRSGRCRALLSQAAVRPTTAPRSCGCRRTSRSRGARPRTAGWRRRAERRARKGRKQERIAAGRDVTTVGGSARTDLDPSRPLLRAHGEGGVAQASFRGSSSNWPNACARTCSVRDRGHVSPGATLEPYLGSSSTRSRCSRCP